MLVNDSTVDGYLNKGVRFVGILWSPWLASGARSFMDKLSCGFRLHEVVSFMRYFRIDRTFLIEDVVRDEHIYLVQMWQRYVVSTILLDDE